MRRRAIILGALAAFAAGCGGDDSASSDKPAVAADPKTEVSSVIELVAPNSGSNPYSFDKTRLAAKAGVVEIRLTNQEERDPHNVRIQTAEKCCDPATDIGGTESISAGQTGVARVKLAPGTYWFLCNITGHFDGDTGKQKGRLVVS